MKRWWFEIEESPHGTGFWWRVSAEGRDGHSGILGGGSATNPADAADQCAALIRAYRPRYSEGTE